MTAPLNTQRRPPLKLAGIILLVILALITTFVFLQFRGKLTNVTTSAKMISRMRPASFRGGRRSLFRGAVICRYTVRLKFGLVP